MSDFIFEGKLFHNPVEFVLHKKGGSWKMPILWRPKKSPFDTENSLTEKGKYSIPVIEVIRSYVIEFMKEDEIKSKEI